MPRRAGVRAVKQARGQEGEHASEQSVVLFGSTRIAYSVERTRRHRTVAIAIDPHGRVQVKAPPGVPLAQLDGIVHRKARWIVERTRRQEALTPHPAARAFVSGETFRYLGRQHRLKVVSAPGAEPHVRLERGWLVALLQPGLADDERAARVRALLIEWYRGHASRRLPERVAVWAARLDVEPAGVLVREQDKRWGSCDARGMLRLNWRVVQASQKLQDYVVAHELVHLIERDHSRAFWAVLGRSMPDYEQRREALRRLGSSLIW